MNIDFNNVMVDPFNSELYVVNPMSSTSSGQKNETSASVSEDCNSKSKVDSRVISNSLSSNLLKCDKAANIGESIDAWDGPTDFKYLALCSSRLVAEIFSYVFADVPIVDCEALYIKMRCITKNPSINAGINNAYKQRVLDYALNNRVISLSKVYLNSKSLFRLIEENKNNITAINLAGPDHEYEYECLDTIAYPFMKFPRRLNLDELEKIAHIIPKLDLKCFLLPPKVITYTPPEGSAIILARYVASEFLRKMLGKVRNLTLVIRRKEKINHPWVDWRTMLIDRMHLLAPRLESCEKVILHFRKQHIDLDFAKKIIDDFPHVNFRFSSNHKDSLQPEIYHRFEKIKVHEFDQGLLKACISYKKVQQIVTNDKILKKYTGKGYHYIANNKFFDLFPQYSSIFAKSEFNAIEKHKTLISLIESEEAAIIDKYLDLKSIFVHEITPEHFDCPLDDNPEMKISLDPQQPLNVDILEKLSKRIVDYTIRPGASFYADLVANYNPNCAFTLKITSADVEKIRIDEEFIVNISKMIDKIGVIKVHWNCPQSENTANAHNILVDFLSKLKLKDQKISFQGWGDRIDDNFRELFGKYMSRFSSNEKFAKEEYYKNIRNLEAGPYKFAGYPENI